MESSIGKVHSSDIIVLHEFESWFNELGRPILQVEEGMVLNISLDQTEIELVSRWSMNLFVKWEYLIRDGNIEIELMIDDP